MGEASKRAPRRATTKAQIPQSAAKRPIHPFRQGAKLRRNRPLAIVTKISPARNASVINGTQIGTNDSTNRLTYKQMNLFRQARVLVADDEPDMLKMVSLALSHAGFITIEAHDGAEALEGARALIPSMIVLDLMMPRLTGTEVLMALRAEPRTADIPVIILSARNEDFDRLLAMKLGADQYMTKPFSPKNLALRIESILSDRASRTASIKALASADNNTGDESRKTPPGWVPVFARTRESTHDRTLPPNGRPIGFTRSR